MTPLVTVVIPTRNRCDDVVVAARSALNQTFLDLEVVVVIDGADATSHQALTALRDPRLRIIQLDQSVGGSEARNVGARAARSEWIAFLDDDDQWLPEKIARQHSLAQTSGSKNTLVACRFLFRETGRPDRISPKLLPSGKQSISEYPFAPHSGFQTSVFFCSRQLLLNVPFIAGLPGLQDVDWFLRVMGVQDVNLLVAPEALSIYNSPAARTTVTRNLTWEACFAWAAQNRRLMTGRAYSLFIVRVCVRRAVEQHSGLSAFVRLFTACMFDGSPNITILALFVARYFLSDDLRWMLRHPFGHLRNLVD